jgi:hypothetical protein
MNIQFKIWKCSLVFLFYNNKRTAIKLVDAEDGSPIAIATVNVPEAPMEHDEVAIKDYSENEGMLDVLMKARVVSAPIRFVQSGFVNIPVCKLLYKRKAHE